VTVTPRDRAAWRAWLERHHATATEVTLVFRRKHSKKPSVSYAEAVEEALCFGWIDGIKKRVDDESYSHRFTPRRPTSKWSDINKDRIARMIADGKMHASGQATIDEAKRSGAWDKPSHAPVPDEPPAEFVAALAKSKAAKRAFDALSPGHRNQWLRWIAEAKQSETRTRRSAKAITHLAAGTKMPG
jgi:uncharacterized protein YdeI (YjbR/CyaY-like superfamily)